MDQFRYQKYKIQHTVVEYLKNIWRNRILSFKNNLEKSKKDFRELKYRDMKIKKDIEDISTKPMNISSEDMYKFEEK